MRNAYDAYKKSVSNHSAEKSKIQPYIRMDLIRNPRFFNKPFEEHPIVSRYPNTYVNSVVQENSSKRNSWNWLFLAYVY